MTANTSTMAQAEDGELLLAHLRAQTVADEGNGSARDDEYDD